MWDTDPRSLLTYEEWRLRFEDEPATVDGVVFEIAADETAADDELSDDARLDEEVVALLAEVSDLVEERGDELRLDRRSGGRGAGGKGYNPNRENNGRFGSGPSTGGSRGEMKARLTALRDRLRSGKAGEREREQSQARIRKVEEAAVSRDPVKSALREIDRTKRQPMATEMHPSFGTSDYKKMFGGGEKGEQALEKARATIARTMEKQTGRRVTLEEMSHGFAPPPGYRLEFGSANVANGSELQFRCELYAKDGSKAGTLIRAFNTDKRGSFVDHYMLKIEPKHQGAGISDTINGNALRHYEKWGIGRATTTAEWVGRYAWARLGFQFDDPKQKISEFDEFVASRPELRGRERELRETAGKLVAKPWKLAKWDAGVQIRVEDGGPEMPIGKAFLLSSQSKQWKGTIPIDRNDEGYRTAISKAAVVPRRR